MLLSSFLFLLVGTLFILLSIPLMRRSVKPNQLYGLRISATFADEWVWYEANARSGRDLLILGLFIIAASLALPAVPGVTSERHLRLLMGLTFSGVVVVAVVGIFRANRLLRDRKVAGGERERSS